MRAKLLGQRINSTIYFAADLDTNDLDTIENYFVIIKEKFNGRYKIGVYGGGAICEKIRQDKKLAEYSWLSQSIDRPGYLNYDNTQKYNIKQSEHVRYNGLEFDEDVAFGDDYGQW